MTVAENSKGLVFRTEVFCADFKVLQVRSKILDTFRQALFAYPVTAIMPLTISDFCTKVFNRELQIFTNHSGRSTWQHMAVHFQHVESVLLLKISACHGNGQKIA